jgi:hypothetical protein
VGGAAKLVESVTQGAAELVEDTPILGQPAGEVIRATGGAAVDIISPFSDPLLELERELGISPELPEQPKEPVQRQVDFDESGSRPQSGRQFALSEEAKRPRSRRSGREGAALGSILLSPSVLGTSSSVLGGQTSSNLG